VAIFVPPTVSETETTPSNINYHMYKNCHQLFLTPC
jgi:hypothetical protein